MKSFSLILLGVFLSAPVFAQSTNITSSICGTTTALNSRGYEFKYQGHTLVLASADYVLDGPGICHEADAGETLRLIKSDWGAGLALFEGEKGNAAPDIQWGTPQLMKKVMLDNGGSMLIMANKSDRHQFPSQKDVLEVGGDMCLNGSTAGAPLFDYNNAGVFMGMMSSQFLDYIPGEVSDVTRFRDYNWTGVDCTNGPFLALNAQNIKVWVDQTLAQWPAQGEEKSVLNWDPNSQLKNIKKINWGPLALTENCPGSFTGGVAGDYPIGGGDPWGIGGLSSNVLPCKFNVTLNGKPTDVAALGSFAPFVQEVVGLLNQNKNVEIYLGYKRTNGLLISTGFIAVGDLFKKLFADDLQLALMVDEQKPASTLTPLQLQARTFRLNLQNYTFDSKDHTFRNRAYLTSLLLEGPDAKVVTHQDLQSLKDVSPWMEYDTLLDILISMVDGVKP